jgi:asparagine synthase (glutamine-hydrolysing)
MAFSIESRVPFLTPALAEFILALPSSYVVASDGTTKAVFRQAMRGIVPDTILDRKDKVGFPTPEKDWLLALKPVVDRALGSNAATRIPPLRVSKARQEWEEITNGSGHFDVRVWRWVNLILWSERFAVSAD